MAAKKQGFGSIGGKLPPFDPKEFAKVQQRSKAMASKPAPKPAPSKAPSKVKPEGLKTRRNRANALAERGLDAL
jgi:hypothetical protein